MRLLKESDEPETRAYLQQKMQQAKWLLNSLGARAAPSASAEAILETQRAFFCRPDHRAGPHDHGDTGGATPPPSLHRLPGHSGEIPPVPAGDVPLRYFFSRALGSRVPPSRRVKLRLLELIRQEDHSRPLSDQKLAELLAEQGIRIARRTVAKYRTELRLGSAAARKRD